MLCKWRQVVSGIGIFQGIYQALQRWDNWTGFWHGIVWWLAVDDKFDKIDNIKGMIPMRPDGTRGRLEFALKGLWPVPDWMCPGHWMGQSFWTMTPLQEYLDAINIPWNIINLPFTSLEKSMWVMHPRKGHQDFTNYWAEISTLCFGVGCFGAVVLWVQSTRAETQFEQGDARLHPIWASNESVVHVRLGGAEILPFEHGTGHTVE